MNKESIKTEQLEDGEEWVFLDSISMISEYLIVGEAKSILPDNYGESDFKMFYTSYEQVVAGFKTQTEPSQDSKYLESLQKELFELLQERKTLDPSSIEYLDVTSKIYNRNILIHKLSKKSDDWRKIIGTMELKNKSTKAGSFGQILQICKSDGCPQTANIFAKWDSGVVTQIFIDYEDMYSVENGMLILDEDYDYFEQGL